MNDATDGGVGADGPHVVVISIILVLPPARHPSCHPSLLFTLIMGWITLQSETLPRSHCEKPLAHQMRHHPKLRHVFLC